LLGFASSAH